VDSNPVVVSSYVPFFGATRNEDNNKSVLLAKRLGATVVRDMWRKEHKQRNAGIDYINNNYNTDYIIWNDTDTWIERSQLDNLITEIKDTKCDAYCIRQRSYWYDTEHALVDDMHTPIICIRPYVRFQDHACIDRSFHLIESAFVHHLSWCKPKDILGKLKNYSHADELTNVDKWYENNWIGWQEGSPAVMPDGKIFEVTQHSLPEELRRYLPLT
jgi:hypothetical protein